MSTSKVPTDGELWVLLAPLVFDNRAAWRREVAEQTDLPFSRYRALRRLLPGPITGTELAERLEVDAPAASGIVADLAGRGLVVKTPDPDDGRRKLVSLTEAGRELVVHVNTHAAPAPIFGVLDDDDRRTLQRILTTMSEATA